MTRPGHLREAFVDLYAVPRMTEVRLKNLLDRFGSPEAVLNADESAAREVEGVDKELAAAMKGYARSAQTARRLKEAQAVGIRTTSYADADYPAALKELRHSPPVLFARGEVKTEDRLAVALVGTRRPSQYGREAAQKLARRLAEHGVTVVSGLARGVDTCAHQGALAAGGRTIAVLGSGLDVCYPPENRRLLEEIAERGAVLSEFTLGTGPLAMNFPKRNRVVSGLSRAVLAVEAGEKSGVLNTVAWAIDQGREVYAIPGRIFDRTSIGTNRLLRTGARPITCVEDILLELGLALRPDRSSVVPVADDEKPVLDALTGDPVHVDEICQGLGLPMSVLLGILMQLELKGLVRQLPGKLFVRQV